MKIRYLTLTTSLLFLALSCSYQKKKETIYPVNADSLLINVHQFEGELIETEATVAHVCGVEFKKMKLRTDSGAIIKLIPADSTDTFDKSLVKKRIKLQGRVHEMRLTRAEIEKTKNEKKLLCHVDHRPCKDEEWIQRQEKLGHANTILEREYKKLIKRMEQTGKDYISVVIIKSNEIEIP